MENTPYLTELYYDKSIKLKSFFISADNSLIHLVTDTESIITLQKADRPGIFWYLFGKKYLLEGLKALSWWKWIKQKTPLFLLFQNFSDSYAKK